jgi:hypothetical protein
LLIADGGLLSYKSLAQSDRYKYGANIFVRGGLKYFDLPMIAAAIADRNVRIVSPLDPMKMSVPLVDAQLAYRFTQATYANANATEQFQIVDSNAKLSPAERYLALVG